MITFRTPLTSDAVNGLVRASEPVAVWPPAQPWAVRVGALVRLETKDGMVCEVRLRQFDSWRNQLHFSVQDGA